MKKNIKIKKNVIVLSILILLIIILSSIIINYFNNKNKFIKRYTIAEINATVSKKEPITEYNTFYTLEGIINNFFEIIYKGDYKNASFLMQESNLYNNSTKEIRSFLEKYNKILNSVSENDAPYLNYVYLYSKDLYLCKVNLDNKIINVLVNLNTEDKTYKIVFLEEWSK